MLLIATSECAVMGVMECLADASREMGVGRGDDHPFGSSAWSSILIIRAKGCSALIRASSLRASPRISIPMRGDKLTGKQ